MAFGSLRHSGRSPIQSDINITPLTDIFLVLLIIFMVTSAAMAICVAPAFCAIDKIFTA